MIPVNLRLRQRLPRWPVSRIAAALRWALGLDGVDDSAILTHKAINPDLDIDVSWRSGPTVNFSTSRTIISQTNTTTPTAQEFFIFVSTGAGIVVRVGGSAVGINGVSYAANTKYRLLLQGTTLQFWVNDELVSTQNFIRGSVRELSALTTIGSAASSFFYFGELFDVRINGVLYPLNERDQALQLPSPTGLGTNILNISNIIWDGSTSDRFVSGEDFGFTAVDTWGQRSFRVPVTVQTNVHYLFDIEVLSGFNEGELVRVTLNDKLGDGSPHVIPVTVRAGVTTSFDASSAHYGSYRDFGVVTNGRLRGVIMIPNATNLNWFIGLRLKNNQNGRVVRLRNLTLRPMWTASNTEIVVNQTLSGATASAVQSWTAINSAVFSYNAGSLVITNGAAAAAAIHQGITTEAGADYVVTVVLKGGNNVLKVSVNAGTQNWIGSLVNVTGISPNTTFTQVFKASGTVTNIAVFVATQTQGSFMEIQSISVRKLDSLCNPINLINTASTSWQEIKA